MLCRLSFHDHLELILSEIELFLYDLESAQTTSMPDHRIFDFYNTTFVNCPRKARTERAGQAPLQGYYVRRAVNRQPGFHPGDS